jgi:micrococcal nuclease
MVGSCHSAVLAALVVAAVGLPPRPAHLLEGTVVRVEDGDTVTVRLAGGSERVRLIGIDAPESTESEKLDRDTARTRQSKATIVALGRRATAYTRRRLAGEHVGLELDVERRDRYGRLLAYVWLGGSLFNADMVRDGYADVFTIPPNVRHAELFRSLASEARAAQRGLWGEGWVGRSSPHRSPSRVISPRRARNEPSYRAAARPAAFSAAAARTIACCADCTRVRSASPNA